MLLSLFTSHSILAFLKKTGSSLWLVVLLSLALASPSYSLDKQPNHLLSSIEFPELDASSFILVNKESRKIILEKDANKQIEPASMTKVMTAYIVFDYLNSGRLNEDDEVLVSEKAWRTGGSKMFIEVNKTVTVIDLLRGLIIQSGNDAAVALAEQIAGTEESFASLMNQYAKDLGMNNSHFKNASGWPDAEHLTTANDLSILTLNMIHNFPDYYKLYSEREFTFNEITQPNRNKLLWKDARIDGVKTGHTEAAGYCLIGSSSDDDNRFIAVVTGTESVKARENAVYSLLKYAHANYQYSEFLNDKSISQSLRVLEGETDEVNLALNGSASMLLPKSFDVTQISIDYNLPSYIVAPVDSTVQVGSAVVSYNSEVLGEFPLYSQTNVAAAGFFGRLVDKVKAMFL